LDDAAASPGAGAEFLIGIADLYANYALQFPSQREAVHAKARAVLNRIDKSALPNSQLRLRLADSYNRLGDTEKAAQGYLEVLKKLGDLPFLRDIVRKKLADIYLSASDRKRAAEQLEAIVREDPANTAAYYYLGSIAYDDKRWADAVGYLKKAVLFSPELEQAHYDLAAAQIALDDADGALATLEEARRRFPSSFAPEFLSGMAHSRKKNYADAVMHFTTAEIIAQATDTNRLTQSFYFQLGAASERKGDREQAQKYFEKCLALEPNFAEALNYLGYMWAEKGEHLDKAREMIEKALKAEPDSAAFLDSMGWVLFKLGQPREALDYLLKAVEKSAEPDATLYDHLGDVHAALKDMDKAREAWRKSLSVEKNDEVQKKLDGPKNE